MILYTRHSIRYVAIKSPHKTKSLVHKRRLLDVKSFPATWITKHASNSPFICVSRFVCVSLLLIFHSTAKSRRCKCAFLSVHILCIFGLFLAFLRSRSVSGSFFMLAFVHLSSESPFDFKADFERLSENIISPEFLTRNPTSPSHHKNNRNVRRSWVLNILRIH